MKRALIEAQKVKSDIPGGAIIVRNGEVISSAHNTKEETNDVTSHAEIIAIRDAENKLGQWRLDDCELYVTLEPCPMCCWTILQSRIKTIYFGSYDRQYGGFSVLELHKLANSSINIYGGIMERECDKLLENFFNGIRR